jgi:predicted nucleotidyltransferase
MTLKEINVLRKLKSLLSLKINSFEIKAYGSRARGDAEDEYSDLDVFIALDKLTPEIENYIYHCAWIAGFDDDIIISVFIADKEGIFEMKHDNSAFLRNIEKDGVFI